MKQVFRHIIGIKVLLTCIVLFGLSFAFPSNAQVEGTKQIAEFSKIWGFLKYHHPAVAKGKFDWDYEFRDRVSKVERLTSVEEGSQFYVNWIESLGPIPNCKSCDVELPDSCKWNLNLEWLRDTSNFSVELSNLLIRIHENRNQGANKYVKRVPSIDNTSYKQEKAYKDSVFPSREMRLLGLARYWNAINYFYPYKYLMDEEWDTVLVDMVPAFRDSKDTTQYHLAMLELTARINDSHAYFETQYTNHYFGYLTPPFGYRFFSDRIVVNEIFNDSLCRINDIQLGDEIVEWDGLTVSEFVKQRGKFVPASNQAVKLRELYYMLDGNTESVNAKVFRNGSSQDCIISRYRYYSLGYEWDEEEKDPFFIMDGNIGFLDLATLKKSQVNKAFKELWETKALIIDVRNYPLGTMDLISNKLNIEKKAYARFTVPDLSYPGALKHTKPYFCGKKNKNAYSGKVILLFDEETQSHGEFTVMALQTAPNVISVGSQTAGADGNVSEIVFPGGYQTWFTGIGVYYPDGRETQRVGIVPDVAVERTPVGIKEGRDEILEKTLKILNTD